MRPGVRIGIGLICAAITFTALTVFAKPYQYNAKYHHCWYEGQSDHKQADSTKTDY